MKENIQNDNTVTIYKWKNNKNYNSTYCKSNHYYCQACSAKVCFNGKQRHLKTTKHQKNQKVTFINPEIVILRIKDGEIVH